MGKGAEGRIRIKDFPPNQLKKELKDRKTPGYVALETKKRNNNKNNNNNQLNCIYQFYEKCKQIITDSTIEQG